MEGYAAGQDAHGPLRPRACGMNLAKEKKRATMVTRAETPMPHGLAHSRAERQLPGATRLSGGRQERHASAGENHRQKERDPTRDAARTCRVRATNDPFSELARGR